MASHAIATATCPACGDLAIEHPVEIAGRYMAATLYEPEEYPEILVYQAKPARCGDCGHVLDEDEIEAARREAEWRFLRDYERDYNDRPRRRRSYYAESY